ncbi:MAG: hypothetical protein AAGE80_06600 [Pseudomonadota bacterium]
MRSFAKVLMIGLIAGPAAADEVSDTIRAALEAYEAGDVSVAKEELDYATQLLDQMKAEGLSNFLPEPLDGWTRTDTSTQSAGAAAFIGGLIAEAEYAGAPGRVTIRMMADSPMVVSMAGVLGNSQLMGSMGTVKRINRQKLVVTPQGEIQALIDNRILVQIEGTAPEEDKLAYFEALDIAALKAF